MNKTPSEAVELIKEMIPLVANASAEVVVCPPAVCIPAVAKAIKGSKIKLGAQNVHFEDHGAFTGEISASMLRELGVKYVIIGHSERRQYFGETDETVNLRTKAALAAGLIPIVCVGELLSEREKGITFPVVEKQTRVALMGIEPQDVAKVVIAYEPVWAIGTGKTATAEQAEEIHAYIRKVLRSKFGAAAEECAILYGGSCKPSNAGEIFSKENVDGGLIGGAALKAEDFLGIGKAF